jgi:prevent-host-death family protein
MKTISAAEANRQFSSVLREVAKGEVFTVLSRGRTVASIAPYAGGDGERKAARKSLLARLRSQSVTGTRGWTRGDLYDA